MVPRVPLYNINMERDIVFTRKWKEHRVSETSSFARNQHPSRLQLLEALQDYVEGALNGDAGTLEEAVPDTWEGIAADVVLWMSAHPLDGTKFHSKYAETWTYDGKFVPHPDDGGIEDEEVWFVDKSTGIAREVSKMTDEEIHNGILHNLWEDEGGPS
jgi:hypothetical protein